MQEDQYYKSMRKNYPVSLDYNLHLRGLSPQYRSDSSIQSASVQVKPGNLANSTLVQMVFGSLFIVRPNASETRRPFAVGLTASKA